MAKSKPVGVRFRQDILDKLKEDHNIESPQQALVFMERFYVTHQELARDITQVMRTGRQRTIDNAEWGKEILENLESLKKDYLSKKHLVDYQSKDRIDLKDGSDQEVKLKDLTKVETSELKPPSTTNVAINTIPKTLNELKTFCPKELTGFEKSEWISKERQKYGI